MFCSPGEKKQLVVCFAKNSRGEVYIHDQNYPALQRGLEPTINGASKFPLRSEWKAIYSVSTVAEAFPT